MGVALGAKSNAVANGQVVKATLAKTKRTIEVIEGLRILLAELPLLYYTKGESSVLQKTKLRACIRNA